MNCFCKRALEIGRRSGGRLLSLLIGLLAVPALWAQESTFEESTSVLEVQVPVNVTTRDGEPLRGLRVEDFEILDEGRRQEVTGFRVVDLELIQPGETRTAVEAALPPAARRHFLLLFDLSFSAPAAVVKAREAAREFVLGSLHPTDLVAVATHSVESGARLLVTFTPDRAQIARAIDTLGAPRLLQFARRDPLRFLIEDPGRSSGYASSDVSATSGSSVSFRDSLIDHLQIVGKKMARMEKTFARGRIYAWSRSMQDLASMLDSIGGRKQVVYFSEGFDGRLLLGRQPDGFDEEAQQDFRSIQFGAHWMVDTDDLYGSSSLQNAFHKMLQQFVRADCVIQMVDISGLTADLPDEERANRVGQDALFYLANETGGDFFEDANQFAQQLERVLERSSVTYLLAFQPSDVDYDGGYHRLKVQIADLPRGAKLSHRLGYYEPRPFDELHPLEKGFLASDAIASAAPKDDLALEVLAAPFRAGEDGAYVPIIIEVEGESLLVGHPSDQLPVELFSYVTDRRGEMKDFFAQKVTLDLSRGRKVFMDNGLKYYGHLDLTPGEYLIRVLVRNSSTGRTGVKAVPLEVPAYEQAQPFLLPPFFLEKDAKWLLVREKLGEQYQRAVVYPFTVNGEPYVPAAHPALFPRDEIKVCLVMYNLGAGELHVDGSIVAEDGRILEGISLEILERTTTGIQGLHKLLATFRPPGLEAGSYTLRVAVTEPSTGSTGTNSIPFSVRVN